MYITHNLNMNLTRPLSMYQEWSPKLRLLFANILSGFWLGKFVDSPFQVVLFTIIELFNEEDVINHHGFERKVPDAQKGLETRKTQRIFNLATSIMRYVVPILTVLFTLIYWAYAIYCYQGQDGHSQSQYLSQHSIALHTG